MIGARLLVASLCVGCSLAGIAGERPDGGAVGAGGAGAGESGSGGAAGSSSTSSGGGGAGGAGGLGPSNEIWAKSFGDADDNQEGTDLAIDRTCPGGGCIVLAGFFTGKLDLGGGELTTTATSGDSDIFLAKLDADGKHLWSKDFGNEKEQHPRGVAVDAAGNVILVGYFKDAIDFGGSQLNATTYKADAFVAKFDPTGAHIWSKQYGNVGADDDVQQAESVAVDAAGNIVVAGIFGGKIDFGGLVHTATSDGQDIFLAKLGPDGTWIWSKSWDGAGSGNAPNVSLDAQGDILFIGNFGQMMDFGCMPVLAAGSDDDVFVAKLSGVDGACVWNKQFGESGSPQLGRSIAAAPNGDAVVLCEINGTVNFGGKNLPGNTRDVVMARLAAADGDHVWSIRATDPLDQFPSAVGVDPASGAVFAFGSFLESLTFDPDSPATQLITEGQEDIFLGRLDGGDGHLLWNEHFGDFASDFGRDLAVDGAGALVVTGRYRGDVSFGKTPLKSVASQGDVFLAKFAPSAPR